MLSVFFYGKSMSADGRFGISGLALKRLAVCACRDRGIFLVCSYLNHIQRTEILRLTVMLALFYCTGDAVIRRLFAAGRGRRVSHIV